MLFTAAVESQESGDPPPSDASEDPEKASGRSRSEALDEN